MKTKHKKESSCSVCKNPVGRYVETGEVEEFEKRIKEVRGKYE